MKLMTGNLGKAATFSLVSALLLAGAFALLSPLEGLVPNSLSGAIVGAISGLAICAAICLVELRAGSRADAQNPAACIASDVFVGGLVGLVATSLLATITLAIAGLSAQRPAPFLWAALVSALAGWLLGGLLGVLIGASWRAF